MPDLTLDGTSLHYETRGSGPPLLLNGVGLDLTAWGPIADAFGRERRLVLLDARGTGRSGPPPEPCTAARGACLLPGPGAARYHRGVQPLPARPWMAPRRKFRGKRKYFRQVLRRALAFQLDRDPPCWWDFWHYHADWPGWGNLGWKYRLEHLRALTVVFRKVLEAGPSMPIPFQTWMSLDVDEAGYDGVFVHTPNPNHANFPFNGCGLGSRGPRRDDGRASSRAEAPHRAMYLGRRRR